MGGAPKFLDLHYKADPDCDHVAKFHGDRPRELGDLQVKEIKKQAGRRTGMRATLVSFLEQSPFATSDIIGHMTISFVIYAVLRYGHSRFSKMAGGRILHLVQPEVGPFDLPCQKTPA